MYKLIYALCLLMFAAGCAPNSQPTGPCPVGTTGPTCTDHDQDSGHQDGGEDPASLSVKKKR